MIVLLASLGVNLALGGLIAGQFLRAEQAKQQAQREAVMRLPNVRNLAAVLPPERADTFRETIAAEWRAAREQRLVARDARRALGEAMRKEPFDEAAVRAAFANVRAADAAVQARFHDATIRVFATMTVTEREAAIKALMRPPRPRPGQGPRRKGGPMSPDDAPPPP
jgi:uncharacterized membrane protein